MKECIVCGRPNSEEHHIVFRSQQKALEHCKVNKIYLCSEHHRGNNSPHKNRNMDIKYKLELQKKLFKLFDREDYKYREKDIKELLGISSAAVNRICKLIDRRVGYTREEIVRACMGGKLY